VSSVHQNPSAIQKKTPLKIEKPHHLSLNRRQHRNKNKVIKFFLGPTAS
jgi:hypothetical protein